MALGADLYKYNPTRLIGNGCRPIKIFLLFFVFIRIISIIFTKQYFICMNYPSPYIKCDVYGVGEEKRREEKRREEKRREEKRRTLNISRICPAGRELSLISHCPAIISRWLSLISPWLTLISHCPSLISRCPASISRWLTLISHCPSLISRCPSLISHCPSSISRWLTLTSRWLTLISHCPSLISRCPSSISHCPSLISQANIVAGQSKFIQNFNNIYKH
jgi:hypothetical protein